MIYVRTCAYNAEKTLRRSIDSILGQTYGNLEYHILDNGSTDGTGKLIREYAEMDNRIIPYFNHVNRDLTENPAFWNLSKKISEGDYFCILDADDFYESTFLEDMLEFMKEHNLEIAACGTTFWHEKSGKIQGGNIVRNDIILDTPEKWEALFPFVYWNMRQVWGKLYNARAAAARYEAELPDWYPAYGGDTINVFTCIKAVKNFGVRAKSLHNYTISSKSASYKWYPKRANADVLLFEKALEFLKEKCGAISENNKNFLYVVYWSAIHDTFRVLNQSRMFLEEYLKSIREIMSCYVTQQMFEADMEVWGITEENKETLKKAIIYELEKNKKKYRGRHTEDLQGIYTALNPDFSLFIAEEHLLWYLDRRPKVIKMLVLHEYENALENLIRINLKADGRKICMIHLVQMLSAVLQKQEIYVFYSKLLIEVLIETGDLEQAEMELAEWDQILPGDKELAGLRVRMEKRKR